MKKLRLGLIFILCAACFCACAATEPGGVPPQTEDAESAAAAESAADAGPAVDVEPVKTPQPTPEPLRIALIGAPQGGEFSEAAKKEAENLSVQLLELDSPAGAPGFDAAILYVLSRPADFSALPKELPATVFMAPDLASPTSARDRSGMPEAFSYVYFDGSDTIDLMYEEAMAYPPHDTPVRFIAMFEGKESPASLAYDKLFEEGKVLPKETWYGDAKERPEPKEWLDKMLKNYYEGMVDGIIAETEAIALAALEALNERGRQDMEIFCAELTEKTIRGMIENPDVFVASVGYSEEQAAQICVRSALSMAKEGAPPQTNAMKPYVYKSYESAD